MEGETEDPKILVMRARQKRNLLATLLLSIGAPMLLMGDELSRTQSGNNNAYCQDNETSWLDWERGQNVDPALQSFIQKLVAIRRGFSAFRRRSFLSGAIVPETGLKDVFWLAPEGREMNIEDWMNGGLKTLAAQVGNDSNDEQRLLLVLNAAENEVSFQLPSGFPGDRWIHIFDTAIADGLVRGEPAVLIAGGAFAIAGRSVALFQHSPSSMRAS